MADTLAFRLRQARAKLQTKLSPKISPVELARLCLAAGFTPNDAVTMVAIAGAESGFRVRARNAAKNGTEDYGVFQINQIHEPDMSRIYDPGYNTGMAYWVWKRQGFRAWMAWRAGKHGEFLDVAHAAVKEVTNG